MSKERWAEALRQSYPGVVRVTASYAESEQESDSSGADDWT